MKIKRIGIALVNWEVRNSKKKVYKFFLDVPGN